ncbi:unnamed protein product [Calypogeia fissa]
MGPLKGAIFVILSSILLQFPLHTVEGQLWPQPQVLSLTGGQTIVLSEKFTISAPDQPEIRSAADRYTRLIKKERWLPMSTVLGAPSTGWKSTRVTVLEKLDISVANCNADLQHGVDESYELVIGSSPAKALLSAKTVWGAMRGLETFSQLVHRENGRTVNGRARLIIDTGVVIEDYPLYPHRGVLLDVSRNFYSVKDIKRTIRALSYNKLNVLHLHITDSQSFPLELESEPALSREGAYGRDFVYSKKMIRELIAYARNYGVRVVPEIDTPGHALSWGGAYPEIITCMNKFWASGYASEPGSGQLNPLLQKTYDVVKNVITEVATLFPDSFYHAGGDEINPKCWLDDPAVSGYVSSSKAATNDSALGDLLTKFIKETRTYIDAQKKTAVYWEDVLLDAKVNVSASALPKETTILQTWNNGPINTKKITAAGYRAIVTSYDSYYLDCGHGGWVGKDPRYDQNFDDDATNTFNYGGGGGSWCAPFKTWARIYDYDITANLTSQEARLVLGGEVALWSEQADGTVLDARLWPRSSAMAESLWSGNRDPANSTEKRYADAIVRLNDWRYRMVGRGIDAEPLQPMWCVKQPEMCNLS